MNNASLGQSNGALTGVELISLLDELDRVPRDKVELHMWGSE
jgi:hypothetical protein